MRGPSPRCWPRDSPMNPATRLSIAKATVAGAVVLAPPLVMARPLNERERSARRARGRLRLADGPVHGSKPQP